MMPLLDNGVSAAIVLRRIRFDCQIVCDTLGIIYLLRTQNFPKADVYYPLVRTLRAHITG